MTKSYRKSAMTAKIITRINVENWETKSLFETNVEVLQGLEEHQKFEF